MDITITGKDAGGPQARMPALPRTPKERPVYTIADQMAAKLYIDAFRVQASAWQFRDHSLKAQL
ncbi:MAG TPA: hypothetical protein VK582_12465 [Pyrinomonadaceae bacterium]|nr:hypothetical protein [Pyrinomonadaceae bacterium]